jgi:hypothetical protein
MTVGHINAGTTGAAARHQDRLHRAQHEPVEGQRLTLQVTRRLDDRRYLATFANRQHIVDSTVELPVGSRVRAAVVAVGEKLELRYLGVDAPEESIAAPTADASANPMLASLQMRFAVTVGAADRTAIEKAMAQATNPAVMANSGLFLSKLALPVEENSLEAIYESQMWPSEGASTGSAGDAGTVAGDSPDLVQLMAHALDADAAATGMPATTATLHTPGSADMQGGTDQSGRESARQLLNVQDDGSVGYRFGVLPVLIGDQLVELDLAYFRERRDTQADPGMRRMVMTFSTPSLGRIEVAAQALSDRLSIGIKTHSAVASEVLAAHAAEVRELVTRLGWNVDTVSYDFDAAGRRASSHIVDHVLQADTLSRLL